MYSLKSICIVIDRTILDVHHGVRRYLMTLAESLKRQGHNVFLVDVTKKGRPELISLNYDLLVNNGFKDNRLVGSSRGELLRMLRSNGSGVLASTPIKSKLSCESSLILPSSFDLCILGAPWVAAPEFSLPKADRYICIAYDAIPNRYYFDRPRDTGLHLFAHAHYQGYQWADEMAGGIFCISELTAQQCSAFGFGSHNGLQVLPPMLPPGYTSIDKSAITRARGRVALLAAPFDRRKGLHSIPGLVNAGKFDSLRIFGRPRCSEDDLVNFFERLELEDVQWWCDVDFDKQVELYMEAKVLIFPSLNEGLGFPVLEAYACGTSVLTSNIKPLNQLVLEDDVLSLDESERFEQVYRRANEGVNPFRYRSFVEKLCCSSELIL